MWILVLWLGGVPLIAAGLFVNSAATLASGSWMLFAGSLLMLRNMTQLLMPRRETAGRPAVRPIT
jgi:hypothetical protein